MRALGPIDQVFLWLERRQQPMHVGGLLLFKIPEGADHRFVQEVGARFKAVTPPVRPFNQRLEGMFWEEDDEFDLEHHFRHIALPEPGRIRELLAYVSQEHSALLDRAKPLWECHLIEGIEGNRFALYFKMHHAVVDGIAGMRIAQKSLSTDPNEKALTPLWAVKRDRRPKEETTVLSTFADTLTRLRHQAASIPRVGKELYDAIKASYDKDPDYVSVFQAPRSILNQRVSGSRRFAAQSYDLPRIKAISKKLGVTINDIVMAMCAGALRTYLLELNALPKKPLIAMVPMSLRKDDSDGGNQITMILANLGTHLENAQDRVDIIHRSVQNAKNRFSRMSQSEIMAYSALVFSISGLNLMTGIAPKLQAFNIVISNVPGPKEPMYWNGAQLDGFYPVSIVLDGMALNITLTSYVDRLEFGLIACRKALPSMQRLLGYLEDALDELETLS
ncbi:WS/DGAT/MGAT family O-acyltransferase [Agitococcus lubricus]|uniref:diacylglycerol O-acyltransferase n=1 Tax=Agitococcus lubricus TaxID=1077255 RepID=A0A2T5IV01_9GAMM|nr:wax ester/triacylglycerol synthase family O-acyltransferase [Agitococcus lubricus]PTQ87721.1 diacylglycerol O-acyltransferase [Agitococcus lubricus]